MFSLNEKLETEIEILGDVYEVDMSFDNVMLFLEIMEDPTLGDPEKVYYGIYTLLGCELDIEMDQQVTVFHNLLKNFVNDGEEKEADVDLEGNVMPVAPATKSYDLKEDGEYIYSSFRQAYGINLLDRPMGLTCLKNRGS